MSPDEQKRLIENMKKFRERRLERQKRSIQQAQEQEAKARAVPPKGDPHKGKRQP